jgi:hypothetical protein
MFALDIAVSRLAGVCSKLFSFATRMLKYGFPGCGFSIDPLSLLTLWIDFFFFEEFFCFEINHMVDVISGACDFLRL